MKLQAEAWNFIKKGTLAHWCFPANFAKFFRTIILRHLRTTASALKNLRNMDISERFLQYLMKLNKGRHTVESL